MQQAFNRRPTNLSNGPSERSSQSALAGGFYDFIEALRRDKHRKRESARERQTVEREREARAPRSHRRSTKGTQSLRETRFYIRVGLTKQDSGLHSVAFVYRCNCLRYDLITFLDYYNVEDDRLLSSQTVEIAYTRFVNKF